VYAELVLPPSTTAPLTLARAAATMTLLAWSMTLLFTIVIAAGFAGDLVHTIDRWRFSRRD